MHSINVGFDQLRQLLPHLEGEKLSKAVILEQIAKHMYQLQQEETQLLSKNSLLKRLYSLSRQLTEVEVYRSYRKIYHLEQEKTQLISMYNLSQQSLTSQSMGNSGVQSVQTRLAKMIDVDEGRELVPGELTSREIANYKERRRMQCINAGFEKLRPLLPQHEGEKLSKAAILQQTAEYINQLEQEKKRLLLQNSQLDRLVRLANPNRLSEQGLTSASSAEQTGLPYSTTRLVFSFFCLMFIYCLVTTHGGHLVHASSWLAYLN